MRSRNHASFLALIFISLAIAAFIVIMAGTLAFAGDGTVSAKPLFDQILDPFMDEALKGLVVIIGTIASLVLHKIFQAVKIIPATQQAQLEAQFRNSLNTALYNAGNMLRFKVQGWEAAHTDYAIQGAVQRFMVQYAIDHASDAIAHFGLDSRQLAIKALAFVPDISTTIDVAAAAPKPAPVEVMSLNPVSNG